MHPLLVTQHILREDTFPHPYPHRPNRVALAYDILKKTKKGPSQLIEAGKQMPGITPHRITHAPDQGRTPPYPLLDSSEKL